MHSDSKSRPHIAILGGGVGGLAAAITAVRAGCEVTILEKNAVLGGKMGLLEKDGFSWDMGPSLLTMPETFRKFWRENGEDFDRDFELVPLEPVCRYRWSDGTLIDEDAAFWQREDVREFLEYSRGLYEISAEVFLENPLGDWWRQLKFSNLKKLRHFPSIASFQTMHQKARRFFKDPHLVQLFNRFATYNGSSPYRAPAAFHIIPYVEAAFGGWYPRGGMHRIAVRLEEMARARGVRIVTECEVTKLTPDARQGVRVDCLGLADPFHFDAVICNADVLSAYNRLLPEPQKRGFERSHPKSLDLSFSGLVLYLGVRGTEAGLAHHNIFFSDDYPGEFGSLFEKGGPAASPTIYVAVNSKSDPGRAPKGCENWFVLVNAPNQRLRRSDWAGMADAYADAVLARLESFGFAGLRNRVISRTLFTPDDFETRHHAWGGGLYGFASHGVSAAFKRPAIAPKDLPGIYFCGGSTHPGGGVPLVLSSGRMAAERALHDLNRRPIAS